MWDDVLLYVIIGFVAQMIDGAIGMAYGVTANSVLLSFGVPPATASACVHAARLSLPVPQALPIGVSAMLTAPCWCALRYRV